MSEPQLPHNPMMELFANWWAKPPRVEQSLRRLTYWCPDCERWLDLLFRVEPGAYRDTFQPAWVTCACGGAPTAIYDTCLKAYDGEEAA